MTPFLHIFSSDNLKIIPIFSPKPHPVIGGYLIGHTIIFKTL